MKTEELAGQTKTDDVSEFCAQVKAKVATVSGLRSVMAHVASMAGKDWLAGHLILAAALSPDTADPDYVALVELIITKGEDPEDAEDDNADRFE